MAQYPPVTLDPVGLSDVTAYLTSESIGWGPEQPGSQFRQYPLQFDHAAGFLWIDPSVLVPGEEFKIVIPVANEQQARYIYGRRFAAGVLVGERFDFDANQQTFWLLTPNFPVVRPMAWNQNNVFLHSAMLAHT